jgi:hypothetical protein
MKSQFNSNHASGDSSTDLVLLTCPDLGPKITAYDRHGIRATAGLRSWLVAGWAWSKIGTHALRVHEF